MPTSSERGIRNSTSAARPHSPAGSTNSTARKSRTTGPPSTRPAPANAGSRLPIVSTPLIAPRLRTFNFNCVLTDLIVAGKDHKAGMKIDGIRKQDLERACRDRRGLFPRLVSAPALVEELGVAAVIVAAEDSAVADLDEAVLLEDAPHPFVVGEGGTAHDLEAQSVEGVAEEQLDCFARVAFAAQVFGSDLYAELAAGVAEVVEGDHSDGLVGVPGLHDEGLHARVLPTGEVVAAGGGEGDGYGGAPVPRGQFGVPIPGVGSLHVRLARRPQGHAPPTQDLDLFGVYGASSPSGTPILHCSLASASGIFARIPRSEYGSGIERYRRGVLWGLREENPGRSLGRRPHRPGGEGAARYRRDGASQRHEPARFHLRGLPEGPAHALRPCHRRLLSDADDPQEDHGIRGLPRNQRCAERAGCRPAP